MENESGFIAWAILRAEAIVADQGTDLLNSPSRDPGGQRERSMMRLTVAIIEALTEARNFHLRRIDPYPSKSH